jgi:hypothetical protein
VYTRPATQFNTASGWVYENAVAMLGAKVTVFVCTDQTVRFGVITQDWTQIAYWSNGKWEHGWVVSQNITRSAVDQPSTRIASLAQYVILVATAHAQQPQQPPTITENPPADAPAAPPPPRTPSAGGVSNPGDSALGKFYSVLFVCMVLGMFCKMLFDALTEASPRDWDWTARLRTGILPILVSPMIFLGLLKAADATSAGLAPFIAIACTAFQNGFFWHTIFDRTGSKA